MKAIIAVNNLGFIGFNGGLPWLRCSEDFKHFKQFTMGANLVVGWRTFQTLPHLNGRVIVVDEKYNSVDKTFSMCESNKDKICIGGKATYEKFVLHFTELHISHIDDNTIGDTLFPNLSRLWADCKIFNYYFKPNAQ